MKEDYLVTVVIPTHNRSDLLPRAIRSVLGQTYKNLECIVVDDASNDSTEQVVREFEDNRLIYLRHETSLHASAARNSGIKKARGEFLAFLDDDDEWLPQKLEKQLGLITSSSEQVGLVYCWLDCYEEEQLVSQRHPKLRGNIFKHTLDRQPIGNSSTLLVRRAVIETVGGFDESLPRGNDGDFIRRICRDYEVDFVPKVLVKVYIGHKYERITSVDEKGLRNAIKGHSVKLIKFKEQLEKYPKQAASIHATIAYYHALLGEWKNCFKHFQIALLLAPASLPIYVKALKSLQLSLIRRKLS